MSSLSAPQHNPEPMSCYSYRKGETTPWDAGEPQPALKHVLGSGNIDFPRTGRALVTGCGRGYDTTTIASVLGLDTLGVDISPTAVEIARRFVSNSPT